MSIFSSWQQEYSAHRIATFPVDAETKRPLIKGYAKVGLRGSALLARRFPDARALAFNAGQSGITVLDVDSTDPSVFREALARVGNSPIVIETASGKRHAWYRHNGEGRQIRLWGDLPVDVLGGGMVIAPPSQRGDASYRFIEGSLDLVRHLPVMHHSDRSVGAARAREASPRTTRLTEGAPGPSQSIAEGARNNTLWRSAMRYAKNCFSLDEVLDHVRGENLKCAPALPDTEVTAIAASAWDYTTRGRNRFGERRVEFSMVDAEIFFCSKANQDALVLCFYLRAHNGPEADFMITNTLHSVLGWPEKRLAKARKRLISLQFVKRTRNASSFNGPARFRWCRRRGKEEGEGVR